MKLAVFVLATATSLLLIAPPVANAQSKPLTSGETVRLHLRGHSLPLEGVLLVQGPNEWTLSHSDGEATAILPTDVEGAEILSSHRNTLKGALIGAGVGFATAGILVMADSGNDCDQDPLCDALLDPIVETAYAAVLLYSTVAGAGGGALFGALIKTEGWVPAVVPRPQVTGLRAEGHRTLRLKWSVLIGR